ncbi:hypothetical protein QUF72_18045 [Desulfobacterales bacterium HSG2]|nr:hypothetical protein [Desulfobacterales bacterium HSG2]
MYGFRVRMPECYKHVGPTGLWLAGELRVLVNKWADDEVAQVGRLISRDGGNDLLRVDSRSRQ